MNEMMLLVCAVLLTCCSLQILGLPHNPHRYQPRNASALFNSTTPSSPGINVTIINNRSLDITSSFQRRVWVQPKVVALPGLTGRQAGGARLINRCLSSTADFKFSHCTHEEDIEGSMQRYIVYCLETALAEYEDDGPYRIWHVPQVHGEVGSCNEDEICINGLYRRTGFGQVARCVKKDDFSIIAGDGGDSPVGLGNRMASLVLSRYDGMTPLGVGSMEAAFAESGPTDAAKSESFNYPSNMCEDCFELIMHKSAPKTDNLKVEASLMTAAAVGVLWLAVLSG